jgi:hypothetical protein
MNKKQGRMRMNANTNNDWARILTSQQSLQDAIAATPATASRAAVQVECHIFAMPNLHVGRGYRFGNLDWFPIWSDAEVAPRDYVTKAPADLVKVAELADAHVEGLELVNDSNQNLLIFEGTLLEGGFQHRALTRTTFIEANTKRELQVVCVERGRWGGATSQVLGEGRAPAKVRAAMRGIRGDERASHQTGPDQARVWNGIADYQRKLNSISATESMVQLRDQVIAQDNLPKVRPLAGQIGVLIGIKGHPVAMEIFDHPETLAERLEAILLGYLPDCARESYVSTPGHRARTFVHKAGAQKLHLIEQGSMLLNRPDKLIATQALLHDNRIRHISTLNVKHELVLAA